MKHKEHVLWPVIFVFFALWILRVLYLPSPPTNDLVSFFINTSIRILFFLLPFLIAVTYFYRDSIRDAFALKSSTILGWIMALLYSLGMIGYELTQRAFIIPTNPWILMSYPFAPIIEELVFRGFIFTELLKRVGKWQTVGISSMLFVLIHFPGWIFIAGLQGENFLSITGSVLIFSLIQGVIRLYAKSVYPNILVHLVNNALFLSR